MLVGVIGRNPFLQLMQQNKLPKEHNEVQMQTEEVKMLVNTVEVHDLKPQNCWT